MIAKIVNTYLTVIFNFILYLGIIHILLCLFYFFCITIRNDNKKLLTLPFISRYRCSFFKLNLTEFSDKTKKCYLVTHVIELMFYFNAI